MDSTQPARDARIVSAAIHPAIGVARVGNSPDEFFLAPEVTEPKPEEPGFYKDAAGALKRQAQRFRVYGYNAAGEVVRELTAADAEIRWTVHVANTKAAWYQFQQAMDIPEATLPDAPQSYRRNATIQGEQRRQLAIDPGSRTISGAHQQGPEYCFDTGKFFGTNVYLGELRTDEAGRLVFLGGRGVAASYNGMQAVTFANNDCWHDDTADGPVNATVRIGGEEIPVEGAWVVVAPPNYAPDVVGVRTLHDLLFDSFAQGRWFPTPKTVSFTRDVWPILQRLSGLQWVNQGFATQFGWGGRNHFEDPRYLARLSAAPPAKGADPNAELRRQVFNSFRAPTFTDTSPLPWPWLYGDAMARVADSPRQYAALSATQYAALQKWADGSFVADWDGPPAAPASLAQVPADAQPAMLDQAALHFCLADAFHPGCEVTWPIRNVSMFSRPFRILQRPADQPELDYGEVLTPEVATGPTGPLHAQGPGDLTRWMAVPWQTDTSSCRSGYEAGYDPYLPTFWPARVPNQVLSAERYAVVTNPRLPRDVRVAAFRGRDNWFRGLKGTQVQYVNQMVRDFGKMGVVELMAGVPADPDLPPVMMVETGFGFGPQAAPPMAHVSRVAVPHVFSADAPGAEAVAVGALEEVAVAEAVSVEDALATLPALSPDASPAAALAGWDSDEQMEQFRARVGRTSRD
jgi:hypothetical protein